MNKLRNDLKHIAIYLEMETDQLQFKKDIKPFKDRMENVIDKLNDIETAIWFKELEEGLNETKKENNPKS